jgi:hypothetical protein
VKHARKNDLPVTLEQLLEEQAAVAYCILKDGPMYAPILERYEREIAVMRARDDTVSRARRILERKGQAALSAGADLKAIA